MLTFPLKKEGGGQESRQGQTEGLPPGEQYVPAAQTLPPLRVEEMGKGCSRAEPGSRLRQLCGRELRSLRALGQAAGPSGYSSQGPRQGTVQHPERGWRCIWGLWPL